VKVRAAVLRDFERARPYASTHPLGIEDIELDEPSYGEVLVRIESAGVCHSDLSTIEGVLKKPLPLVVGHEAAGVIEALGPGVTRLAVGDHVVFSFVPTCGTCPACTGGRPALCEPGNRANGSGFLLREARRFRIDGVPVSHHLGVSGFSTYTVAAQESVVRIPSDVPLEIASIFGCAALTGLGAVFEAARVSPGTTVAVFGAGGVGLMATIAADVIGASATIVVDPVESKRAAALALGASATIDPTNESAVDRIKELTGGRGADFVIEASGVVRAFEEAVAASAPGGVVVAVGLPAGTARAQISPAMLVAGDRTVRGSFMGSSVPQRDIPRYIALWRRGKLPVERMISGSTGLDGLNDAMDKLATGAALRTVVRPHA
jgi:alcohol dehydrogenase